MSKVCRNNYDALMCYRGLPVHAHFRAETY